MDKTIEVESPDSPNVCLICSNCSYEFDGLEEDADREMIGDDVGFGLGPIGNK